MSVPSTKYSDLGSLEKAIKNGELGENLAKRAQEKGDLQICEQEGIGIAYRVFTFSDFKSGYTFIIDKNKLVLLCKGRGGGYAYNFKINNKSGHKVLYFDYETVIGIKKKMHGQYNLGSCRSLVSDNN